MKSVVKRCFTLLLFTTGLLAGLQLPGFVQQYEQQLSARLAEAKLSLSGFQSIANEFHNGDLSALIAHHQQSSDPSFRAEATVIYNQWKRVGLLSNEVNKLNAPLPQQLWHLATNGNRQLIRATANDYSATVPINTTSIVSGVLGGAIVILLAQAILLIISTRTSEQPRPVLERQIPTAEITTEENVSR